MNKMQKNLLWEAYTTLQRTELREFARFVRSPFFNNKTQLIGLSDYLRVCTEKNVIPNNDAAFAAAYPELAAAGTDMVKLRLANSDLLALLEHYWVYNEKFADNLRDKIQLSSVYRRRGLEKHFQITLREARQNREKMPWRHAESYHNQYLLEWEQFQFAATQKRYDTFNLQEINDLMDTNYIAHKLRLVCVARSHQTVTGQQYDFGLFDPVLQHLDGHQLLDEPAVGLYYHACYFLAQHHPDAHAHFFRFRGILTQAARQFPPEELRTLYLLALNFCIKNSNTGAEKMAWFRQTWELYREALDYDILLENGQLSRFAFNNIASVAVHLGEVEWAAEFIQQYIHLVEKKFRAAARSLNLARVAFAQRRFDEALQHLQEADYRDLISGMSARIIQLKIYYETAAIELLESHLDSIKTYLLRQRATGYHRDNYLELVRITRALIRCNSKDTNELNALRQTIIEHPNLMEKEWFLAVLKA
jgi:hypothetical protein